jgi:hypothetical protein
MNATRTIINRKPTPPIRHAPVRESIGEVLGPGGLHEVLACGHIQPGRYDRRTGMPNANGRHCLQCLWSLPRSPLAEYVLRAGRISGPVVYPDDPEWEINFAVPPTRTKG